MFSRLDARYVKRLADMELQMRNHLKFFIIPSAQTYSNLASMSNMFALGLSLSGNLITTLYLQSMTFPAGPSVEYDEFTKRPKGLTRPDEVSFSFLEDNKGTVWRYLQTWRKSIVYCEPSKGSSMFTNPFISSRVNYVFADNQESSERIGILLLQSSDKKRQRFPRIMFYGLKLKSIENVTLAYTDRTNLVYSVTCSVREVAAPLI